MSSTSKPEHTTMSFFKKLGTHSRESNNSNHNNSNKESSNSSKKQTSTSSSTSSSSSSSSTLKNRSQSIDGSLSNEGGQSWLFNLKAQTYKSIEAKVGSKVTLNIKNRQDVQLKKGDRFFFSISTINKARSDRIMSQSTVIQEPTLSKDSNDRTLDVLVQFEKLFVDPIPRTIFEQHPNLSDLVTSKGSFTKIPDSHLSQFLDIISNYSNKTVKKEAMNFLSGISLGDINKKSEDTNLSNTGGENSTPTLNITPSLNNTPLKEPLSLEGRDYEISEINNNNDFNNIGNNNNNNNSNICKDPNWINEFIDRYIKVNNINNSKSSSKKPSSGKGLKNKENKEILESLLMVMVDYPNDEELKIICDRLDLTNDQIKDSLKQSILRKKLSNNGGENYLNNNLESLFEKEEEPILSQNTPNGNHSLPHNLLSQIQQRCLVEQQQQLQIQQQQQSSVLILPQPPYLQYQPPPPKHQISQLQLDQQQQQQQQQQSKKRNTIEEYNLNYNLSIQQKIVFVTNSGQPISVFSLIKGETRKTKLKISKKDHHHDGIVVTGNTKKDYHQSSSTNTSNINSMIINNQSNNIGIVNSSQNSNTNNCIGNDNQSNIIIGSGINSGVNGGSGVIVNSNSGSTTSSGFYLTKESILNNLGLNYIGKKEISYAHLLALSGNGLDNDLIGDELDCNGVPLKYDPTFLDNSELKTGKHRTVMNLPSYKVSIFPFIKKGAIKEELNEQFRQKHQWISQPGITLYKIRKIKRKLKKITIQSSLEISTLGLAYVLIEKLIMKNFISGSNFKLIASTCLLLAAKFNDTKAMENQLGPFFDHVEKRFDISKKELLASEFLVFSQLSFTLHVSPLDVLPHLNRLKSEAIDQEELIF